MQPGRDLGDSVEVLAGLSPSDRIINNPPETLTNGDTVRVAGAPQSASAVAFHLHSRARVTADRLMYSTNDTS